jgi:hypothetical protein
MEMPITSAIPVENGTKFYQICRYRTANYKLVSTGAL